GARVSLVAQETHTVVLGHAGDEVGALLRDGNAAVELKGVEALVDALDGASAVRRAIDALIAGEVYDVGPAGRVDDGVEVDEDERIGALGEDRLGHQPVFLPRHEALHRLAAIERTVGADVADEQLVRLLRMDRHGVGVPALRVAAVASRAPRLPGVAAVHAAQQVRRRLDQRCRRVKAFETFVFRIGDAVRAAVFIGAGVDLVVHEQELGHIADAHVERLGIGSRAGELGLARVAHGQPADETGPGGAAVRRLIEAVPRARKVAARGHDLERLSGIDADRRGRDDAERQLPVRGGLSGLLRRVEPEYPLGGGGPYGEPVRIRGIGNDLKALHAGLLARLAVEALRPRPSAIRRAQNADAVVAARGLVVEAPGRRPLIPVDLAGADVD